MPSTTAPATIFELKAEARRLAQGLQGLNISLAHSQVLDLIGRVHGHRDWRELVGVLSRKDLQLTRYKEPMTAKNFLTLLEWTMRCHGFLESDLDELVYEHAAPADASDINNSGIFKQLEFLLEQLGSELKLLETLREELSGFDFEDAGVLARATLPGTTHVVQFDALPWFLHASEEQAAALIVELKAAPGPSKGPRARELLRWSAEHGRDICVGRDDTERLQAFLAKLPSADTPVAVSVNRERTKRFQLMYYRQSPETVEAPPAQTLED